MDWIKIMLHLSIHQASLSIIEFQKIEELDISQV